MNPMAWALRDDSFLSVQWVVSPTAGSASPPLASAWFRFGAAGHALGLLASALFDLPAGATIVLALVGSGLVASGWTRHRSTR
jgi:ABC-type Mn2+/Zn2+ transport system permease subunit